MIKIDHLVKNYGANCAVDDISFEVAKGEIVGLLGPNGAGKSTTMNILTGYLSSTAGRVIVDGLNVLDEPLEVKRRIGYLPEQPPLYPDMTVEEYLIFVYNLKGCTMNRTKHLEEICEVVRIKDVYKRVIRNLSKGYKQRVGIAQALIGNPPIIIFDEPTVGLDPKQIIEVRNLIRTLGKRHTVILSTHILAEVQSVCERVLIINKGKLIADERTADIVKTIEDGYGLSVKIAGPEREVEQALSRISGVKKVRSTGERDSDAYTFIIESDKGMDVRRSLFALCSSKNWAIYGLGPVGTDLESVFIRLIDRGEIKAPERKSGRR